MIPPVRGTLGTLLKLLERGVVSGGDASEAMDLLARVVGAEAVAAGQGHRFAPWSIRTGLPDAWIEAHARYFAQDQIVPRMARTAPGTWFFVDHCSDEEKRTDLYESFGDHFGDGALARVYSPFVSDLHIVLYRERGRRFTDDERTLLTLLTPHIARGLATRRALAALDAPRTEGLDDVLRSVAGHATISFPSQVVTWSARAKRLWKRRLEIGDPGWARLDRMLLAACARFDRGAFEARSQVLIPGIRADFANVPPEPGERRRVLCILVADTTVAEMDDAPAMALLTERQRLVARRLVVGSSLPEIAKDLGISLETARGYRKEIYARLGVTNRVELVATLR